MGKWCAHDSSCIRAISNMPAQAEITSIIQKDMAVDLVNGAKAGHAVCGTSSFETPSFVKTLRNLHSLVKVVLQGPSGRLVAVHLAVESSPVQDRVHFRGSEWRDFLLGNGFKVRHELLFSLVSKSTFTVRHSGVAAHAHIPEPVDTIEQPKTCHDMRPANLPETNGRPSETIAEVRHGRDKPRASGVKSDVVYARGTPWTHKQRVDMLVGKLQCPHFVATINKSHLREWKSSSLSVPREFYNKYATYFSDGDNIFQGPGGRMWKLRFSDNSLRFTSGWKAFHRENDIELGDVLLFSLCEPTRWLIQFVERKLEEVPMESECGSSDLE